MLRAPCRQAGPRHWHEFKTCLWCEGLSCTARLLPGRAGVELSFKAPAHKQASDSDPACPPQAAAEELKRKAVPFAQYARHLTPGDWGLTRAAGPG